MKLLVKTMTLAVLIVGISPVSADVCGLRGQMRDIERRIDRGAEDGRLTPREVRRLEREQREIKELARDLRSDGRMSDNDCDILTKRVDRLSGKVRYLKHNDRVEERNSSSSQNDRRDPAPANVAADIIQIIDVLGGGHRDNKPGRDDNSSRSNRDESDSTPIEDDSSQKHRRGNRQR
jgi:hypothetical protein